MKPFATTEKTVATAVATVSKDRRLSQTITFNPQEKKTPVAENAVSPPKRSKIENPPTRYHQPFRIQPYTNPCTGSQSWRVTGFQGDGTRIRENFADVKPAECRQIELTTEWLARGSETISGLRRSASTVPHGPHPLPGRFCLEQRFAPVINGPSCVGIIRFARPICCLRVVDKRLRGTTRES